jgi:hypothetical protein
MPLFPTSPLLASPCLDAYFSQESLGGNEHAAQGQLSVPGLQSIPAELLPYITDCLDIADVTRLACLNQNKAFATAVHDVPVSIQVNNAEELDSALALYPRLARLTLGGYVSDQELRRLTLLNELKEINLLACQNVSDSTLEILGMLHSLDKIVLDCKNVTDLGLSYLARLPSAALMQLEHCEQITDAGLAEIGKMSSLKALSMRGSFSWNITDAGLAHLGNLHQLEVLTIKALSLQADLIITDVGLQHIGNLAMLKTLDVDCWGTSINVTNSGLASLGKLTYLQSLRLGGFRDITNPGFQFLSNLPALNSLSLVACRNINAEVLDYLKAPALLTTLELCSGSNIHEECLHRISALPSLKRLSLNKNFPTRLPMPHLMHLKFTDSLLEKLNGLPRLEELSLAYNPLLTGRGLSQLKRFPSLKFVDLEACRLVGKSDVRELCLASMTVRDPVGQVRYPEDFVKSWCSIL